MAGQLSPRQLIFYIRAENQASRVFRNVARDFKAMTLLRDRQQQLGLFKSQALARDAQMISRIGAAQDAVYAKQFAYSRQLSLFQRRRGTLPGLTPEQSVAKLGVYANAIDRQVAQVNQLKNARELGRAAAKMEEDQLKRIIALQPYERYEKWAGAVSDVGQQMRLLGIIGTASVAYAAVAAKNLSTSLTLAATQARQIGAPATQTAAIQRDLMQETMNLMQRFPATAQSMADSYYKVFSGTNIQNTKTATQYLGLFNRMAVAGGTDLSTMADIGVVLINQFAPTFKEATQYADAFFAAVRYGNVNATQLATSLTKVVPIAKAAGLGFYDIADALAFLSRMSTPAQLGGTATGLTRLIETLGRTDVTQGLREFGVEVEDNTGKMRPLLKIIGDIKTQILDTGKIKPGVELLNFFKIVTAAGGGSGTALGAFLNARKALAYLIKNYEEYAFVSGQVNRDVGELAASFQAMSKTPGVQWGLFTNRIKVLAYTIGNAAIPALISMFGWVGRLTKWFNGLSGETKTLIGRLVAFGSVGMVVAGTLAIWGAGIARLIILFKIFTLISGKNTLMAAMFSPTKLVIFAAALTAVVALLIKYPGILRNARTALDSLSDALGGINEMLRTLGKILIWLAGLKLIGWFVGLARASELAAGKMATTKSGTVMLRNELGQFVGKAGVATASALTLSGALSKLAAFAKAGLLIYITLKILAEPAAKKFDKLPSSWAKSAVSGISRTVDATIGKVPIFGKSAAWAVNTALQAGTVYGHNFMQGVVHSLDPDYLMKKTQEIQNKAVQTPAVFNNIMHINQEIARFEDIRASKLLSSWDVDRAQRALAIKDWKTLDAIWKSAKLPQVITGTAQLSPREARKRITARFETDMPRLINLYQIWQNTDKKNFNLLAQNYKRYHDFRLVIEKYATAAEKAVIDDILGSEKISYWTDAQFQTKLQELITLKHRFELTKRLGDAKAYQKALDAYNKKATEAQKLFGESAMGEQEKVWVSQAKFYQLVQQAQAAQAAMAAAKTNDAWYAAAKNYQAIMETVNNTLNNQQSAMFGDAVNNQKKAGVSMARFWKDLAKVQILQQRYAAVQGTKSSWKVWNAYRDALEKLNNESNERQADFASEILGNVEDKTKNAVDNLKQIWLGLFQQNQQYLTLFGGPWARGIVGQVYASLGQYGIGFPVSGIMADIEGTVTNLTNWQKILNKVKSYNIPQALWNEIIKIDPNDPAARANMDNLMKILADPRQRGKYLSEWNKAQTAIEAITKIQLKAQIEFWRKAGKISGEAFVTGLKESGMTTQIESMVSGILFQYFPGLKKNIATPKSTGGSDGATRHTSSVTIHNHNTTITPRHDDVQALTTALKHHYWSQRVLN